MTDSSNKPREFFLYPGGWCMNLETNAHQLENYDWHVVEHSALVEAQAKIRELEKIAANVRAVTKSAELRGETIDQLRAQLTEALEVIEATDKYLERQYSNCLSPSGTARDAELDSVRKRARDFLSKGNKNE